MDVELQSLDNFRRLINRRARQSHLQWEASRRLIEESAWPTTLAQLRRLAQETDLPAVIAEPLRRMLERQGAQRVQELDGELLRSLTGLPPAKAVRALCIFFELVASPGSQWPISMMPSEEVERRIRRFANPFDLLCDADVASVLDLGAGDLSFAAELAERYVPQLQQRNRRLILHCIDRLDPSSKLGGPLHPHPDRVRMLRNTAGLTFACFGNQDMCALSNLDERGELAPIYTIVTCWAPATPAFAYEPSRLSASVIADDLAKTKGASRHIRYHGEEALEVRHGDRALLFPPWKFEIAGPVALLNLLAGRGSLCVLGAVDNHVFWELLAQLLDDPRYRPPDRLFTAASIPEIFGEVAEALYRIPVGGSVDLSDLGALRRAVLPDSAVSQRPLHDSPGLSLGMFRYIRISRGATFPEVPASSTAKTFSVMVEEPAPWFLTLVPA